MKLLNIGFVVAASLTLVSGMGSKSKTTPRVEELNVLPESIPVSAPAAVNTPVQLIENTAEENKKIDEALNTLPSVTARKPAVTNATKKAKVPVAKKKKVSAKTSKKTSPPAKKKN